MQSTLPARAAPTSDVVACRLVLRLSIALFALSVLFAFVPLVLLDTLAGPAAGYAEEPPAPPAHDPKAPARPAAAAEPAPPRDPGFLGVQTGPRVAGDPRSGLVVRFLYPGSTAEALGLQVGDEIRILNDLVVTDQESFARELRRNMSGARIRMVVMRDGEEKRLSGKLGTHAATMLAYQEALRKEYVGKTMPAPPGVAWWDPETRGWKEGGASWGDIGGKLSVVLSFDDCQACKQGKLLLLARAKTVVETTLPDVPTAFVGAFFSEQPGRESKEANQEAAAKLFDELRPPFRVGVAYYPAGPASAEDRGRQFLLHNHGIALVDADGSILYLQTYGVPQREFGLAFQKALEDAAGKAKAPATTPDPGARSPQPLAPENPR